MYTNRKNKKAGNICTEIINHNEEQNLLNMLHWSLVLLVKSTALIGPFV